MTVKMNMTALEIEDEIKVEIETAGVAVVSEDEIALNPVFLGYVKLGSKMKLDGVKLASQRDALRLYMSDPWAGHVIYRHDGHQNGITSTAYGIGNRHPLLWLQVWGDKPDFELDLPQIRPLE